MYLSRATDGAHAPRDALRALGVRTATDLKRAWGEDGQRTPMVRNQLAAAVGGGEEAGTARIEIVLQSLEEDASFLHVHRFRRHDWLHDVVELGR